MQTVFLKTRAAADRHRKPWRRRAAPKLSTISTQAVGPSWGQQITQKASIGLVVFLALVVLYLSVWFEWRMAIAALVALAHDIVITVGIYALVGFEVTPATVIGVLTILGYSLYDTVVVFDKVRENTRAITGSAPHDIQQAANLAVNQTLVRSINTSIVGLLPVASLLFVGRVRARRRDAEGPGAGPVRRHRGRHLLVGVRRDAGAGRPEEPRPGDPGPQQARSRSASRRGATAATAAAGDDAC